MNATTAKNFRMPKFQVLQSWDADFLREARENVITRISVLEKDIDGIFRQLQVAGAKAESGGLVDPIWWRRASDALRYSRNDLNDLRRSLGEIEYLIRDKAA
jgi:hypothetical protein